MITKTMAIGRARYIPGEKDADGDAKLHSLAGAREEVLRLRMALEEIERFAMERPGFEVPPGISKGATIADLATRALDGLPPKDRFEAPPAPQEADEADEMRFRLQHIARILETEEDAIEAALIDLQQVVEGLRSFLAVVGGPTGENLLAGLLTTFADAKKVGGGVEQL